MIIFIVILGIGQNFAPVAISLLSPVKRGNNKNMTSPVLPPALLTASVPLPRNVKR